MKYSLNPFRWLLYLINRIRYRHSRWLHYYASVPYSNTEMKRLVNELEKEFWNTKFKSLLMKGINETT